MWAKGSAPDASGKFRMFKVASKPPGVSVKTATPVTPESRLGGKLMVVLMISAGKGYPLPFFLEVDFFPPVLSGRGVFLPAGLSGSGSPASGFSRSRFPFVRGGTFASAATQSKDQNLKQQQQ